MITSAVSPGSLVSRMECLADETRLRLLRLLERNELGVAELCEILQLPQSTVSRHLKVLGDGQWVNSRTAGTNHLYRMLLDEIDPAARRLWLLAREQTEGWATLSQDELRLRRRLRDRETESQAFFAGAAADWDKLAVSCTVRRSAGRRWRRWSPATGWLPTLAAAPGRPPPNWRRSSGR